MVLDGFIPILSSAFRLKSTLILLPLFRLHKGNYRSPFPCLSMEALDWLAFIMGLSPKRVLPIARSFDPIVITGNNICSILVRLVSANLSVIDYWYLVIVISPKYSGQWWCWYIVEVSFEMRNICNLVSCCFLLFACHLFSYFARFLFNFLARYFLNTLVCLIFVVRIRLMIFLDPIFFSYVITISQSTVMVATFSKSTFLCSGYDVHLYDFLRKISI